MGAAGIARYLGVGTRDEYFVISIGTPVMVEAGEGTDYVYVVSTASIIYGQGSDDVLYGIGTTNDTIYGDFTWDDNGYVPGNDQILSFGGSDSVFGGGGNDFVNAGSGNDLVSGGPGADVLWGGSGRDLITGDAGNDVIWGASPASTPILPKITVEFDGVTDAALNPTRTEGGLWGETVNTDASPDTLLGGAGYDLIIGGQGSDYIEGNGEDDVIEGGWGHDIILGGVGSDNIRGNGDNDAIQGDQGNDIIFGDGGIDWLEGNDGNDSLIGGVGNDRLDGGAGNDWIECSAGYDYLIGGAGSDSFVLHRADIASGNWATISDLGKVAGDSDAVVLEGFGGTAAFVQSGANTLIYSTALGLIGGIVVNNTTVAEISSHLVFI